MARKMWSKMLREKGGEFLWGESIKCVIKVKWERWYV